MTDRITERGMPESIRGNPEAEHIFRQVARGELYKRVLITAAVILSTIAVGLMLLVMQRIDNTTTAIRNQQKITSPIIPELEEIGMNIQSCIDPDGSCYKRSIEDGQARVDAVNIITELTIACADRPGSQTLPEIQACVKAQYNREKR